MYFQDLSLVRTGMLSVVSECLPGPNVSPNSPRYMNCTTCDSRTMSWAPFLIALSSSGKRYDNVSRVSSVHSMTSITSPLMHSLTPIAPAPSPCNRSGQSDRIPSAYLNACAGGGVQRRCWMRVGLSTAGCLVLAALGQSAPQIPPIFRSEVQLIQVDAIVSDAEGRSVPGLTADDFVLFDGCRRTPVEIAAEVNIPPPNLSAEWMRSASVDVVANERLENKRLVVLVLDDGRWSPRGSSRARVQEIARHVVAQLG